MGYSILKSGVAHYAAFLADIKKLSKDYNKAEITAFFGKYAEQFSPTNAITTILGLLQNKVLVDFDCVAPISHMKYAKILINILRHWEKPVNEIDKENAACAVYCVHLLSTKYINDLFTLLLSPQLHLEKGEYKKYLDEIKESYQLISEVNASFVQLVKTPLNVFSFNHQIFKTVFRENILSRMLEGIVTRSKVAYLLHTLGETDKSQEAVATIEAQLQLIERHIKNYCKVAMIKADVAHKQLEIAKREHVYFKDCITKFVGGALHLTVLQSLERLNGDSDSELEYPYSTTQNWSDNLATIFDKVKKAINDKTFKEQQSTFYKLIFKHLPRADLTVGDVRNGVSLYTNAKSLCLELRNRYLEKSKKASADPHKKMMIDLIVVNLENLIKKYILIINDLNKLKQSLYASDLIQEILDLPFELDHNDAYHALYEKYRETYFKNDEHALQTLERLIADDAINNLLSADAYFRIYHFINRTCPVAVTAQHPRFYFRLWHHFSTDCIAAFSMWNNNKILLGFNGFFIEDIQKTMMRYRHYRNLYQQKRATQKIDIKEQYDELLSFASIESFYAGFLCDIGDEENYHVQREELHSHLESDLQAAAKVLQQMVSSDSANKATQEDLDKKLKELNTLNLAQTVSSEGEFFSLLQVLKKKLTQYQSQLVANKLNNTIGDTKVFTTPLMLLEDILRNPEISNANIELLFTACDYVNESVFTYERRSFMAQLCVLLLHWRNGINEQKKSAMIKLLFEQLTELLEISREIYTLIPELKDIPPALLEHTIQFVGEVGKMTWTQIEEDIQHLQQRYQQRLFVSREVLFMMVSRIPFYLYPNTSFETDMKVVHTLIKIVARLEPTLGTMDLLVNELYLGMYRSICNSQITLCVRLHEKKVATRGYHTQIASIENGMSLLEKYLPIFEVRHPCFKLDATQDEFEEYWQNLKSLCDVYLMHGVACVMQMEFKKAKKSVVKAQKYITILKENTVTAKQVDYIQQLERCSADLVGHWTVDSRQVVNASVWRKAYQQLQRCENQLEEMLVVLRDPNHRGSTQAVTLIALNQETPLQGFLQLLEALNALPKLRNHLVKTEFTLMISKLREYEKIFGSFNDANSEAYCMVELITEKLTVLNPRLEAALELLPEIQADSPPLERLRTLFENASITDKPEVALVSKPKKMVQPHFNDDLLAKRLPPAMRQDDPKILELIKEAENIAANLDDLAHYFLFESFKHDFANEEAIKALMKAAIHKLQSDEPPLNDGSLQKRVNLSHFLLMYFSQNMKQSSKINKVCLDMLWKSLSTMLTDSLQSCLENRVPLGECTQALDLCRSRRCLYEYYALQATVISDPIRFKRIPSNLFEQFDKIDQSSKDLRQALAAFYQDELMKTLVEVSQPNEQRVVLVNRTAHLVKELRSVTDLTVENLRKLTGLVADLRNTNNHWQAVEFFKVFQPWLKHSINRFKKPYHFADCLLIESIQLVLTCCERNVPSEPEFEAEVEVVAQLDKLQIKAPSALRVPEWVKQFMAQIKTHQQIGACHLVGGAIRDLLLNIVPNDYDFNVDCSYQVFMGLYADAYQPAPHKRPELVRLRHLEEQGITHDIVCVDGLSPYTPDLTINALRFDGTNILDSDGYLADINKPYLIFKGDSATRFKSDPSMILRAIRLSTSTGKYLQANDLKALKACAPLVTSIEMGLYLGNLIPLFLRSLPHAYFNINKLLKDDLLCCLLPAPLCQEPLFINWSRRQYYLHYSLLELYMGHNTPHGVVFNANTKYELLAIFLLPVLMARQPNTQNKTDLINELVNDYCHYFQGFAATDAGKHHTAFKVKASLSRRLSRIALPEPVRYFVPRLSGKGY